jgi:hypothetical protein
MFVIPTYEPMDTESFLDNIKFDRGETFFNRAKTSLTDILNIKKFLEDRMKSGVDSKLKKLKDKQETYSTLDWSEFIHQEVPVSVGFNTNIYMLTEFLNDNVKEAFGRYVKLYGNIDKELNKFIGDKEHRLRKLTFSNTEKEDKYVESITKDFNSLMNFKTHGLYVASIKDLVINNDGYNDTVDSCYTLTSTIDETEYEKFVEMNRKLDMKLKVVYELLHVEEVTYTKEALKELSDNINTIASFSTMMGKMILATYESSFILFNIEKVLKEYE